MIIITRRDEKEQVFSSPQGPDQEPAPFRLLRTMTHDLTGHLVLFGPCKDQENRTEHSIYIEK